MLLVTTISACWTHWVYEKSRVLPDIRSYEMTAVRIAESVPQYVVGDSARLRQILANLLSNAVKFTDSGSISVTAWRDQVSAEHVECSSRVLFVLSSTSEGPNFGD